MSTRVVERVDGWDDRPFAGGYHELRDLANEGFSGVVRAGGAELFMASGTVVGVDRGTMEDFEDASGTVFEAPGDALPLLAAMQADDGDVRGQYYSEDTAISEVDRTLSDGGFTGFIELSENVLSGDYYVVYHGGESMAVGFVGESSKLLTDDEAFRTADDEVGIYTVRQVAIESIDLPEPTGASPGATGTGVAAAETESDAGGDAVDAEEPDEPTDAASESTAEPDDDPDGAEATGETTPSERETSATGAAAAGEADGTEGTGETDRDRPGDTDDDAGASGDATATADRAPAEEADEVPDPGTDQDPETSADDAGAEPAGSGPDPAASASESGTPDSPDGSTTTDEASPDPGRDDGPTPSDRTSEPTPSTSGAGSGGTDPAATGGGRPAGTTQDTTRRSGSSGDAGDLETRSIPSLNPDRSKTPQRSRGASATAGRNATGTTRAGSASGNRTAPAAEQEPAERADPAPTDDATESDTDGAGDETATSEEAVDAGRVSELESELADRESEIERLESELEETETERDDLRDQLDRIREERDELAEEVERLEEELRGLEEELGAATDAERRITSREALDGTDIFVRYHSKGDATLAKAHDGSVRKEDVADNLRLENHTQFDADAVAVGGQSYEEFLGGRPEYRFIRWAVEHLLFEIRDTGHAASLQGLYDALPDVDRAELNGVVNVVIAEDGQETRTQESFDVVLRDRMGNPLLVANLNDSRQGATESMMTDLVTAAERVGQSSETMAAAFLVTRSFFEPEALETASEATRSGLLSRDKRRSFVNLGRKRGYHLCLVEARNDNFHLAVPEL